MHFKNIESPVKHDIIESPVKHDIIENILKQLF